MTDYRDLVSQLFPGWYYIGEAHSSPYWMRIDQGYQDFLQKASSCSLVGTTFLPDGRGDISRFAGGIVSLRKALAYLSTEEIYKRIIDHLPDDCTQAHLKPGFQKADGSASLDHLADGWYPLTYRSDEKTPHHIVYVEKGKIIAGDGVPYGYYGKKHEEKLCGPFSRPGFPNVLQKGYLAKQRKRFSHLSSLEKNVLSHLPFQEQQQSKPKKEWHCKYHGQVAVENIRANFSVNTYQDSLNKIHALEEKLIQEAAEEAISSVKRTLRAWPTCPLGQVTINTTDRHWQGSDFSLNWQCTCMDKEK